ncbi:COG2426 family protein [Methanosalsum natronophilum]|uniref:COG2426 family protein n=1 Tax=Methanosalsum natronophilum TaxID=768733 RepID=UPI002166DE6D|nr:small multi-drug export protein [Methanosalsum natronophilum]MCS3923091.1 putative membrane protein [Methanosalsum natronophilum]
MNPINEILFEWLINIPPWLSVIFLSTIPFGELRVSIPFGLTVYGMDPISVYFLAIIGNLIPVFILLPYLEPVSIYLRNRFRIFDLFFTWLFDRTRVKHTEKFERYGTLALILFVSVPLPVTGAWTACAAAFVFGIRPVHALTAITFGLLIGGLIVTILTLMSIDFFNFIAINTI